jgi:hypothetical protein
VINCIERQLYVEARDDHVPVVGRLLAHPRARGIVAPVSLDATPTMVDPRAVVGASRRVTGMIEAPIKRHSKRSEKGAKNP